MRFRCRRFALLILLLAAAIGAQAQPFDGCPSAAIGTAFEDFGKTGRMPPAFRLTTIRDCSSAADGAPPVCGARPPPPPPRRSCSWNDP